jgi:hypothetical protein
MATTYKIKGISDDQTECDCCGRKGLKRTVALEVFQDGDSTLDIIRVGVDCASVLMSRTGKPKSAMAIRQEAQFLVEKEKEEQLYREKALTWKLTNRIAQTIDEANDAYLTQFKTVDYTKQDHGVVLTDGKRYVRVPTEKTVKELSSKCAELEFLTHLSREGFTRFIPIV